MRDRVIDAHQHFWNVTSGDYDWPTPDLGSPGDTSMATLAEVERLVAGVSARVIR